MAVTTPDEYLFALQGLLPHGPAWSRDADAPLTRILSGLSAELSRLDDRADRLIEESDPRTTFESLPDWERVAGLPDSCSATLALSVEQRQASLTAKITMRGGQSRPYFIEMAAKIGFPGATITEFSPMTCNDTCKDALWSEVDRFVWQINLPSAGGVFVASCNSDCNAALASWGNAIVECAIRKFSPAHTTPLFAYV